MSDIPTDAESSDDDKVVAAEREIALASFLPKRNLNKFYFVTLSNSFLIHNLAENGVGVTHRTTKQTFSQTLGR